MDQKLDDQYFTKCLQSPFGEMIITTNETHLLKLSFDNFNEVNSNASVLPKIMTETIRQLDHYFKKTLSVFDLPVDPLGTEFQKNVWNSLKSIPTGTILTYQKLAEQVGNTSKTRAVASAIAKNPILIIIPCHRVIGSNRKLTGYSGGIERKKQLLIHENKNNNDKNLLF